MKSEDPNSGFYVDLEKTSDGNLRIVLNQAGQKEFETIEEVRCRLGIKAALVALLEDHLGNEWEFLAPEDIGALTSAPILSDEVERDEEGQILDVKRVYWYPEYQISDEIGELREKHEVLFHGVPPLGQCETM